MQASLLAKSFLLEITMLTTTVSGGECSFRVVSMTPQKAELYLQRFWIFCSIFYRSTINRTERCCNFICVKTAKTPMVLSDWCKVPWLKEPEWKRNPYKSQTSVTSSLIQTSEGPWMGGRGPRAVLGVRGHLGRSSERDCSCWCYSFWNQVCSLLELHYFPPRPRLPFFRTLVLAPECWPIWRLRGIAWKKKIAPSLNWIL